MNVVYPVAKHFRLIRGTTFSYSFKYYKTNVAVDLTNYTAQWTITWKTGTTSHSTVYTSGVGTGESGVSFGQDPTQGEITLIITDAAIALTTWTNATHHLDLAKGEETLPMLTGSMDIVDEDNWIAESGGEVLTHLYDVSLTLSAQPPVTPDRMQTK